MNEDINNYVPSILNPRCVKKHDISLTQNSIVSRCSLSLKRGKVGPQKNVLEKVELPDKENSPNTINLIQKTEVCRKNVTQSKALVSKDSITFSAINDLEAQTIKFGSFNPETFFLDGNLKKLKYNKQIILEDNQDSYKTVSSATELVKEDVESEITLFSEIKNTHRDRILINISFGINNCESLDVTTRNSAINRFTVTHNDNSTNVDCEVLETSQISTETIETEFDENMNDISPSQLKRSAVSVNLEIKKQKLSATDRTEYSKVLILNTNAIEKFSHVIVQPPNYKFVKRNLTRNKLKNNNKSVEYGKTSCLKQIPIDSFFRSHVTVDSKIGSDKWEDAEEMSRNSGVIDAVKCERVVRPAKVFRREGNDLPKSAKLPKREAFSPRRLDVKTSNSEAPSPRLASSKNAESIHFSLPTKSKSNKSPLSPRNIPHHKIVAGTHFAVDAFSYGDIPNVKHYFLTHFHTDHYSGLKKSFNKLLFCSKITADLCISRLGVNPKCIHVINIDETLRVDSVEVTAVDANHCPGALMLVFTLPNGKTLLHTGDFRACPPMESYPVFWNRDIHTIYLDTTYCNPRYDFPTQDQSLEMALYILRQKKMALEKADKKFSSVLIVCGTYTIGKEKFFLGMSRRVGCSVWACPEKERVLKTVEGKACSRDAPEACQLHVVPMRDLTHEKLRSYLDSLQGAFSEVVAFKPSGWENGKNSCVEKDGVTIHGIPYSEHSSFSELIRFVKFLKPKQVVPTVDISGGVKAVQKYFPCPLVYKDEIQCQSKLTDYFSIQSRQQASAVT